MINNWNWPILGHIEVSITMALFKSDWRLLLNLYGRYAIVDRCFLFVSPVLFGCFNAAYWYPPPWMMISYHLRLFRIAKTAFAILDIFVMNDDDAFKDLNKVFNVKVPLPRSLEISPAEVREFSFCPFTVVAWWNQHLFY